MSNTLSAQKPPPTPSDEAGCSAPPCSADRPTKKFLCQYYHDGSWWSQTIDAYDFEDAEIRAKKLSMQLDGEYVMTVDGRVGFLAPLICRIRNFFFR